MIDYSFVDDIDTFFMSKDKDELVQTLKFQKDRIEALKREIDSRDSTIDKLMRPIRDDQKNRDRVVIIEKELHESAEKHESELKCVAKDHKNELQKSYKKVALLTKDLDLARNNEQKYLNIIGFIFGLDGINQISLLVKLFGSNRTLARRNIKAIKDVMAFTKK